MGIDLINFHDNINGMFYGQKRKIVLDNLVKSLREIVTIDYSVIITRWIESSYMMGSSR